MSQPIADDILRYEIEELLADDFLVDRSKLGVEVVDGVVTLVGTVGTYAEKAVALAATRSVPGVHDVINAVTVKPTASVNPDDDELERMVTSVLAWDALVPDRDIDVSVTGGVVTLTGGCPTVAQVREAERAIGHLVGVQQLVCNIQVAEPDIGTHDVRVAITRALERRVKHRAAHIDVIVDKGHVILAGPTQSAGEKRAILGAVRHAPGVVTVRDELSVGADGGR